MCMKQATITSLLFKPSVCSHWLHCYMFKVLLLICFCQFGYHGAALCTWLNWTGSYLSVASLTSLAWPSLALHRLIWGQAVETPLLIFLLSRAAWKLKLLLFSSQRIRFVPTTCKVSTCAGSEASWCFCLVWSTEWMLVGDYSYECVTTCIVVVGVN